MGGRRSESRKCSVLYRSLLPTTRTRTHKASCLSCRQTRFLLAWPGLIVPRERTHTRSSRLIRRWLTWRTSWRTTSLRSVRSYCSPTCKDLAWIIIVFSSLVTDYERKFVLGVATPQDLEVNFFCLALAHPRNKFATDPILSHHRHSSRGAVSSLHIRWSWLLYELFYRHDPANTTRGYLYIDNTTAVLHIALLLVASVYKKLKSSAWLQRTN